MSDTWEDFFCFVYAIPRWIFGIVVCFLVLLMFLCNYSGDDEVVFVCFFVSLNCCSPVVICVNGGH